MKRRKSLLRAAKLLKKTLLSYKEVLFDWDLTEIEPRDDALILKHDNRRLSWEKPINFPDHLTSNPEHKEAALVKRMALHTLSILGPMTRALVKCKATQEPLSLGSNLLMIVTQASFAAWRRFTSKSRTPRTLPSWTLLTRPSLT